MAAGARLPADIELRLPGKRYREIFYEPTRGYHVRLQIGEPPTTVH